MEATNLAARHACDKCMRKVLSVRLRTCPSSLRQVRICSGCVSMARHTTHLREALRGIRQVKML